jgi:hypothetical protein
MGIVQAADSLGRRTSGLFDAHIPPRSFTN